MLALLTTLYFIIYKRIKISLLSMDLDDRLGFLYAVCFDRICYSLETTSPSVYSRR